MSTPIRLDVFTRGAGKRTPKTLLENSERYALVRLAAREFYGGLSIREAASRLAVEIDRYRAGAWRRERIELTCPARHQGTLQGVIWHLLKVRDAPMSEHNVRRIMGLGAIR